MKFHPSKCTHMKLGNRKPDFNLHLDGVDIPQADLIKYLGLNIHSTLKWTDHINDVAKKPIKP